MTDMSTNQNTRGALIALAGFAIFATHDVVVKYLGAHYSAFQIVFFSVLYGFPFITFILMREEKADNLRPKHPWWTLFRTIAVVITGYSAFFAFSTLPLAQTYAILFATPLLITLFSIPMLGEKVGIHRGLAVVVGLVGVIFVLRPGSTEIELGHFFGLVAAVTGAFASIIVRKVGREERSVVLILYPMMANFVIMGAALPFVYEPMPLVDMGAIAIVAALALVANGMLIVGYRIANAVVVAPMQYSQIIWASIFGALLFDESIDMPTLIGAGIIIASGVYIVLREDRGPNSANTPVLRARSRVGVPVAPRVASFLTGTKRGPQSLRARDSNKR